MIITKQLIIALKDWSNQMKMAFKVKSKNIANFYNIKTGK
jgi:hypothetical protein